MKNKRVVVLFLMLFISVLCYSQNKYRLDFNTGVELLNYKRSPLLFERNSVISAYVLESKFLFLTNKKVIHGLNISYSLNFTNIDLENKLFLNARTTPDVKEYWVPDTVLSMSHAHNFSLMYGVGVEKIFKEKHAITFLVSLGGFIYKLPSRLDIFNNREYYWKGFVYGFCSQINLGYTYLINAKNGIQFSFALNQQMFLQRSYKNYESTFGQRKRVNLAFLFPYQLKLGYVRYF